MEKQWILIDETVKVNMTKEEYKEWEKAYERSLIEALFYDGRLNTYQYEWCMQQIKVSR